jgi:hypothetical protein
LGPATAWALAATRTRCVCLADRRIHVLGVDGTPRWEARTLRSPDTRPALAEDGAVYVGADRLHAFAPDGGLRWAAHTPSRLSVRSRPVITEASHTWVCLDDYTVSELDGAGRELAAYPVFRDDHANFSPETDNEDARVHAILGPLPGPAGRVYLGADRVSVVEGGAIRHLPIRIKLSSGGRDRGGVGALGRAGVGRCWGGGCGG